MSGVLDTLTEFSWRGLPFPVTAMSVALQQDTAEHKYWGQDSARVESTGRAPLVIHATIPFRNGIAKARTETWASGNLYPTAYRTFLTAMAVRTVGVLAHPELGPIKCKARSADTRWDPNRRDGADVEAAWVETIDDTVTVSSVSSTTAMVGAAVALDNALGTMIPPPPPTPIYKPNFADTVRSIVAIGDTTSLLKKQIGGQLAGLNYRAQQIETSVQNASAAVSALAPSGMQATVQNATNSRTLLWPIIEACEALRNAISGQQQRLLQQQRAISFYIVPQRTTLGGLAVDIPEAGVGDLIRLNPQLLGQPCVEAKTVVRYYTPRST